MALTFTPKPQLGIPCPEFNLPAVDGKACTLKSFQEQSVLVVMFICNHCPYVKAVEDRLLGLAANYDRSKVAFVAICSNDPDEYPEDSFENLRKRWQEKAYPFPYLHDKSQTAAIAFDAVCTPDFFVYDKSRKLSYRGRLDDNWKDASKVTQQELAMAIDMLLMGEKPIDLQYPSMGCSIKWIS